MDAPLERGVDVLDSVAVQEEEAFEIFEDARKM